jgi:hypothetical protein
MARTDRSRVSSRDYATDFVDELLAAHTAVLDARDPIAALFLEAVRVSLLLAREPASSAVLAYDALSDAAARRGVLDREIARTLVVWLGTLRAVGAVR